ncbi:MAG: hypothetical protein WCA23_34650, partial [Stellaceae bacterium]
IRQVEYNQCKYPSKVTNCVEIEFTGDDGILKLTLAVSDALRLGRDLDNYLRHSTRTGTTDDIDPFTGAPVPR